MDQLILYSKPGCHLCEVMKQVIDEVARRRPLALAVKNILDNPQDQQRYRHDIPVLLLNGREIARHRLTAEVLEAALEDQKN